MLTVRFEEGVNVAVFVPASYITAPVRPLTVNVDSSMVAPSIKSLKVAVITLFTPTLAAVLAGVAEATTGADTSKHTPVDSALYVA